MTPLPELDTVATPALAVEGPALTRNIAEMANRARARGIELWPHSKTHKSRTIAALQREHGIGGVTVATVREAESLAGAGFEDILVAYPPVGEWRVERLVALARNVRLRVVLDSVEVAEALDSACRRAGVRIGYLWEIDCGVRRIGSEPGEVSAELVAPIAVRTRHAFFAGLMAFAGHVYAAGTPEDIAAIASAEGQAVLETAAALTERGIEVASLSVGTTPTAHNLECEGEVTEIRPGNYVFYDATQVALGLVGAERCALSVLTTVVSRPHPQRLILDAGSKALAAERLTAKTEGFGFVVGHPELVVERLFEEHAIVTAPTPVAIPVGARLRIVPNHACAAANLHERILVTEEGHVVDVWAIEALGWEAA